MILINFNAIYWIINCFYYLIQMFKKLKKSVIDKKSFLLTNLGEKRVNRTPNKFIFPNRTNLTFANIIVNMNNSIPSFKTIDSCNNSYFNTDLYNNTYSKNILKTNISNTSRNDSETKNNYSEILSIVINGILSLKSNDLLNYSIKLIEIVTYIKDNKHKNNYIDIKSEINKDLLMIIFQIYFKIFPKNSFIYSIIKNDLTNEAKIFKKSHTIYILFILTGLYYIHDKFSSKNKQFYNFLNQFIKKEKCLDSKCPICTKIEQVNNVSFIQKPSVIKIMERKFKKNNIINHKLLYDKKYEKNLMNISNDNTIGKKIINTTNIEKDYYTNIDKEKSSDKIKTTKNRSKERVGKIKKKIFCNQLILNTNEKEKLKFFKKGPLNNKFKFFGKKQLIQNQEKNKKEINNLESIDITKFNTEKKEKNDKKLCKISKDLMEELKMDLNKKLKGSMKKEQKKITALDDNNSVNNKLIDINKNNKKRIINSKKIKLNILTDPKIKTERRIYINLNDLEKKNYNSNNNIEINQLKKNKPNLNGPSKIINENLNLIEKEIKAFKEHNLYIKQQLEQILNKKK